jgi:uncharacterized protein YbjQ (UPF0145 family)
MSEGEKIMILTTLDYVPGRDITEHYGVITGSTVRSKHFGKDLFAGLKNIVGGELKAYTELMEETRKEATDRLVAMAKAKGADAVIGLRYGTSDVAAGAAEVLAYGTAVKLS